jgi:hypothetical protein
MNYNIVSGFKKKMPFNAENKLTITLARAAFSRFRRLDRFFLAAVASKSSSGVVGKWGSFSSVRPAASASSDLKRSGLGAASAAIGAPKPKKFFKSRDTTAAPAEDDDDEITFKDSLVSKVRAVENIPYMILRFWQFQKLTILMRIMFF